MTVLFFSVSWSSPRDCIPFWGTVLKQCSWPFWGLRLSWDVVFVDVAVCHLYTLVMQLQGARWTRLRVRAFVTRPCLEEHVNRRDFCQLNLLYMPWSSSIWGTHSPSNPPQPFLKPPPPPPTHTPPAHCLTAQTKTNNNNNNKNKTIRSILFSGTDLNLDTDFTQSSVCVQLSP